MNDAEMREIRRNNRLFISPRARATSVGAVPVGARESTGMVIPEALEETPFAEFLWGRKGMPTQIAKARE